MTIREAIKARHSVRQYLDKPIEPQIVSELKELIARCNQESGLNIQLICDESMCFDNFLSRLGKFSGVNNYLALVGKRSDPDLYEKCGYFGEKIVIDAQRKGLNTCWVGGNFSRIKCQAVIGESEKLVCVIAIGYGDNQGNRHRSKSFTELSDINVDEMPDWFKSGMIAAMMAPTAINQQRFRTDLVDGEAVIKARSGFLTKLDLGIVKYNFEAASGHKCR